MTVDDISPKVYGIRYFFYNPEKTYADIRAEKIQYTYRFMFFESGTTEIQLTGEKVTCNGTDALLILPGEKYKVLASKNEFRVVSIFFDFVREARKGICGKESVYVYPDVFCRELCSPVIDFSDNGCFNKSRLFKKACSTEKIKHLVSVFEKDSHCRMYAEGFILSVMWELITNYHDDLGADEKAKDIAEYIMSNVTAALNADKVASAFGYHKNYLNYLVKKHYGLTLSAFIRREKISLAKVMLTEGRMKSSDIAQELGYYDFSHFYKAFTAETGISPNSFAKLQKGV